MWLATQLESTWPEVSARIPWWHPRNEGDGGDGGGDGDNDDSGGGGEGIKDPEVLKAYAKLREAEEKLKGVGKITEERNALEKRLKKLERDQMTADEKRQAEQEDKDKTITDLQTRLDARDRKENIAAVALEMKLRNPNAAHRMVPSGVNDEKGVREALAEAVKDFPELVGTGPAPPPVNKPGVTEDGSMNSRMNQNIRAASGRTSIR